MKIAIYSSKGSAGKTPIATNIVLDRDYAVGTNEPFQLYDTFIPDERVLPVAMDEPFPEIPDDVDIVFDLAGSMSASAVSIVSAIKQADLVIVPCWNNVHALTGMIGTLNEVRRFNQNILVIATKLQKRRVGRGYEQFAQWKDSVDCQNIMDTLKSSGFSNIPVLPLKFSTVFDTITEKEQSIRQLMENDPLAAHTFKDVAEQFDAIYRYIDSRGKHAKQEQRVGA